MTETTSICIPDFLTILCWRVTAPCRVSPLTADSKAEARHASEDGSGSIDEVEGGPLSPAGKREKKLCPTTSSTG